MPSDRQFKLSEDEWADLIVEDNPLAWVRDAGQRPTEDAISYYRWVSPHGGNPNLTKRIKNWVSKVQNLDPTNDHGDLVRELGRFFRDPALKEALVKAIVGEPKWSMSDCEHVITTCEKALRGLPEQKWELLRCLIWIDERTHHRGGTWKSGDAEFLIYALADVLRDYAKYEVTRSNLTRDFIAKACSIATRGIGDEIDQWTIDAHLKNWIWEKNFEIERGMTVLQAVLHLHEQGLVGFDETAVPGISEPRRLWIAHKRAVEMWRTDWESVIKPLLDAHASGESKRNAFLIAIGMKPTKP